MTTNLNQPKLPYLSLLFAYLGQTGLEDHFKPMKISFDWFKQFLFIFLFFIMISIEWNKYIYKMYHNVPVVKQS